MSSVTPPASWWSAPGTGASNGSIAASLIEEGSIDPARPSGGFGRGKDPFRQPVEDDHAAETAQYPQQQGEREKSPVLGCASRGNERRMKQAQPARLVQDLAEADAEDCVAQQAQLHPAVVPP